MRSLTPALVLAVLTATGAVGCVPAAERDARPGEPETFEMHEGPAGPGAGDEPRGVPSSGLDAAPAPERGSTSEPRPRSEPGHEPGRTGRSPADRPVQAPVPAAASAPASPPPAPVPAPQHGGGVPAPRAGGAPAEHRASPQGRAPKERTARRATAVPSPEPLAGDAARGMCTLGENLGQWEKGSTEATVCRTFYGS